MYRDDYDKPRYDRRERHDRFSGNRDNRYDRRERYDREERSEGRDADDVYSKPIRAGKRTYFFDVKTTRGNDDFYMTITESKRRNNPDGTFSYDKHKIFLYKEDFQKFSEGLAEVIEYIKENCFHGEIPVREEEPRMEEESDVEFENL